MLHFGSIAAFGIGPPAGQFTLSRPLRPRERNARAFVAGSSYVLVYRVEYDLVWIIRLLHAARAWPEEGQMHPSHLPMAAPTRPWCEPELFRAQ